MTSCTTILISRKAIGSLCWYVCVRKRQRLDRSLCMCVSAKSGDWIAMLHALQTMIRNSDWIAVYVCVRKTAIGSLCRCVCIRPQSYRHVVSAHWWFCILHLQCGFKHILSIIVFAAQLPKMASKFLWVRSIGTRSSLPHSTPCSGTRSSLFSTLGWFLLAISALCSGTRSSLSALGWF